MAQTITHEVIISQSSDDAEQEGVVVTLNDLELDLGWDQGQESFIGLHFRDAHIDAGAVLDSAYLRLVHQQDLSDTLLVSISLESSAFPIKYVDTLGLREEREFFSNTIDWELYPASKGDTVTSPDLSSLLQEAVDLNDWGPSSGFNFSIRPMNAPVDSSRLEAEFYSSDQNVPARKPKLFIVIDSNDINGVASRNTGSSVIYPNPSNGLITVRSEAVIQHIQVRDLRGRLVQDHSSIGVLSETLKIVEKGVFLLMVENDRGKMTVHRLIIH